MKNDILIIDIVIEVFVQFIDIHRSTQAYLFDSGTYLLGLSKQWYLFNYAVYLTQWPLSIYFD